MNPSILDSNVAKEVLMIILNCNKDIADKIPDHVIRNLTDMAADSSLEVHLDKNKKLNEQNLSNESLDMFALLYYTFVAETKEKEEIYSKWSSNSE